LARRLYNVTPRSCVLTVLELRGFLPNLEIHARKANKKGVGFVGLSHTNHPLALQKNRKLQPLVEFTSGSMFTVLASAFDSLSGSATAAIVNEVFAQVLAQVLKDQPGCDVYTEALTREVQQLYETRCAPEQCSSVVRA
jgi:hypothetical protein